ncbi:MAG: Uma2 family endonuclease, partial [Microcystaceae cyanobacterium]
MSSVSVKFDSFQLSDDQYFQLCRDNRDLRFERNIQGDLMIMPPTGGLTGERNSEINFQLRLWNKQHNLGKVFDSSTGFKLPNGSDRSPDAAWIAIAKWNQLTPWQQERFLPLCPDFVIELLSPSDKLETTQNKMLEYLENGTALAWLINRKLKQVEIYRSGKAVEILANPETLSGELVLPNF